MVTYKDSPRVTARSLALASLVAVCGACGSDSDTPRSTGRGPQPRTQSGSAGSAATAPVLAPTTKSDSSNAPVLIPTTTPATATSAQSGPSLANCSPGAYVGKYNCMVSMGGMPTDTPIDGDVSFFLEVNSVETKMKCPPGAEFCDFDLVIKEGSGKLFGFVLGVVGFQTGLQGGLDCRSGKFHADAVGGIYGVPEEDPDDPGKLRVGLEVGTFQGDLDGLHGGKVPQVIAGTWNLGDPAYDVSCPGPFSVELMP